MLSSPFALYSDETKSELAIARAAAEAHARYGPRAITTYLISKAESVSDLLEVNILLKEAGLWTPGEPPHEPAEPELMRVLRGDAAARGEGAALRSDGDSTPSRTAQAAGTAAVPGKTITSSQAALTGPATTPLSSPQTPPAAHAQCA